MKKSIKYLLYITILLIFPTTLLAQSEDEKVRIHGKVLDASTKKAIPYVSIRIKNSANGGSSDSNGTFSFYSPIDQDTLIASSLGYAEESIAINAKTKMPLKMT